MKKSVLLFTFILTALTFSSAGADNSDPNVVPTVDLNRYAGLWYDIAHSPNFFQRKCIRSTAEYKVLTPLSVSVKNTCFKADNSTSDIEGEAKVVDSSVPAKLKVRFNFFARGDYWIVDLDPEYQWAVVSGPKKKSLFILSRKAPMDPKTLSDIMTKLNEWGFETKDLVYDKY